MGRVVRSYEEGDELTPLVKQLTQEAINLFEGSAGNTGPSQFTDEHAAKETLGTEGTVASGRMSLTFAIEMLRPVPDHDRVAADLEMRKHGAYIHDLASRTIWL